MRKGPRPLGSPSTSSCPPPSRRRIFPPRTTGLIRHASAVSTQRYQLALRGRAPHTGKEELISWCRKEESNLRPTDYESVALPTELFRHRRKNCKLKPFSLVIQHAEQEESRNTVHYSQCTATSMRIQSTGHPPKRYHFQSTPKADDWIAQAQGSKVRGRPPWNVLSRHSCEYSLCSTRTISIPPGWRMKHFPWDHSLPGPRIRIRAIFRLLPAQDFPERKRQQ